MLGGCKREDGGRAGAEVTFYQDVAPIVAQRCSQCHHPGDAAPFALMSLEDVKKRAKDIVKVTQSRFMPPWLPEAGHGEFANERRLSDEQIATIKKWVDGGMAEGKVAAVNWEEKWKEGWQLGQPDLIAMMPKAYTLASEGRDVYRNFVVPLALDSSRWVKAVELHAGNRRVVHHAVVMFDISGSARRMDALDDELGYPGMDAGEDVGMPAGQFLNWQPGKLPPPPSEERSWRLVRGADLVVQMHMRPDGKAESLRPEVGFYFTDKAPGQFPYVLQLKSQDIDIPAGEKNYLVESSYTLPVDVDLLAIFPHAHYLGHELAASARLPDGGTRPLILIKNWDLNWQGDYQYAKPISLPKGSQVSMRFSYDNSEQNIHNPNHPPRRVLHGPDSSDEMAEVWLQVIPRNQESLMTLVQDYRQSYSIPNQITHCRNVLKESPDDAKTRANLGAALVAQGQLEDGIVQLRRAIALQDDSARAHFNLAVALAREEKVVDAIGEYEKVLSIDAGFFRAHNNLGMIYFRQGKLDVAAHHFYNALSINPNDAMANMNLAKVFLSQQKWGQARLQLENLLRIEPDNAFARGALSAAAKMEKQRG